MTNLFKELLRGLKWLIISIITIISLVGLWIGCAWSLGWLVYRFIDLKNFGADNFIAFGSCVLVFLLLIQIITIIIGAWVLIAWGRSHGLMIKENKKGNTQEANI